MVERRHFDGRYSEALQGAKHADGKSFSRDGGYAMRRKSRIEDTVAYVVIGIMAIVSFALLFVPNGSSGILFFASVVVYWTLATVYAYRKAVRRFRESSSDACGLKLFLFMILGAAVGGAVLEGLTLVGSPIDSPLSFSSWNFPRLATFAWICCPVVPLAISFKGFARPSSFDELLRKEGFSPSAVVIVISCVAMTACVLISGVGIGGTPTFLRRALFFLLCALFGAIACIYLYRKNICRPELFFSILAISVGSVIVFATPSLTGVSWDDQIHFDRAWGMSYLGDAVISEANEDAVAATDPFPWYSDGNIDWGLVNNAIEQLDEAASGENWRVDGFITPVREKSLASLTSYGCIPNAIGLWIGRWLHLSFTACIVLGRWANLILYTAVMAAAVYAVPRKKILFAALGLIPTALYLASNFSYDPWVISFIALGLAQFMKERSKLDTKLSLGAAMRILVPLSLGLCAKLAYAPLLGLLLLMPNEKFSSKRTARAYRALLVGLGLLAVACVALPYVIAPESHMGDARGGDGINSFDQLNYILSNPVEFMGTLFCFMIKYLSPSVTADIGMLNFAYMGWVGWTTNYPLVSYGPFLILVMVSIIDAYGPDSARFGIPSRIWMVFLAIGTATLIAIYLYIDFTPVGSTDINGVQARYLLPLAPLFFMALPEVKSFGGKNGDGVYLWPVTAMAAMGFVVCWISVIPWQALETFVFGV